MDLLKTYIDNYSCFCIIASIARPEDQTATITFTSLILIRRILRIKYCNSSCILASYENYPYSCFAILFIIDRFLFIYTVHPIKKTIKSHFLNRLFKLFSLYSPPTTSTGWSSYTVLSMGILYSIQGILYVQQ